MQYSEHDAIGCLVVFNRPWVADPVQEPNYCIPVGSIGIVTAVKQLPWHRNDMWVVSVLIDGRNLHGFIFPNTGGCLSWYDRGTVKRG